MSIVLSYKDEIQKRKPLPKMVCSECGAEATASCHCEAPYVSPGKLAEAAIKRNPEMSDRAIAAKLGVDDMTIGRARKRMGAANAAPVRIGKNGVKQKVKKDQRSERRRWHSCDVNPIPLPTTVAEAHINHAMGMIEPLRYVDIVTMFRRYRNENSDKRIMKTWRHLVKAFHMVEKEI